MILMVPGETFLKFFFDPSLKNLFGGLFSFFSAS